MKLKSIPLLLLLPALMLLLVACGGGVSESDIEATVEARVEQAKASLVAPTAAPLPTYTPLPIPTPKIIEKVVVKEVPVEKIVEVVVTATPTPTPTPVPEVVVEKATPIPSVMPLQLTIVDEAGYGDIPAIYPTGHTPKRYPDIDGASDACAEDNKCTWDPKFGHWVKGARTYLVKATNPNPFWVSVQDFDLLTDSDSCSVVNGKGELLTEVWVGHDNRFIIGLTKMQGSTVTGFTDYTHYLAPLSSNYLTIRVKADKVNRQNKLDFTPAESVYFKGPCELSRLSSRKATEYEPVTLREQTALGAGMSSSGTNLSEWISPELLPDELTLKTIEYEIPEPWQVLAGNTGEYYRLENRSDKTWLVLSRCTTKLEVRLEGGEIASKAKVRHEYRLWIERGSMPRDVLVTRYRPGDGRWEASGESLPQEFIEFNIHHATESSILTHSQYAPCIDPAVWFKEVP